jgi:hypothetical protein
MSSNPRRDHDSALERKKHRTEDFLTLNLEPQLLILFRQGMRPERPE